MNRFSWLALVALVATAACNRGTRDEPGAADAGAGPDVTNDFDDDTVYLYGVVGERSSGSWMPQGLVGAELCIVSHPELPCVTTGADGGYRMDGVPADTDIQIMATKEGHVSGATQVHTYPANGEELSVILSDDITMAAIVRPAGYEFPLGDVGMISFRFGSYTGGGLAGAVVTASSGDVVYAGQDGAPDPELTASGRGNGYVFAVTPGEVTLDVQMDGFRCNLVGEMTAFAGEGPNQVIAVAHAGAVTSVNVTCAEQEQ